VKVIFRLDGRLASGGAALLQHNERLADPLDEFARELKNLSGKRGKTDAEHLALARVEFMGGLYTNGNGPCVPADNVLACLTEAARRRKRGKDVDRGVFPLAEEVDLLYDGPRDPDDLWKERETFSLRKGVGIQGKKVTRTRPLFPEWAAEFPLEIDPDVFDIDTLQAVALDAGRYIGLGDRRPRMGRFAGEILTDAEWLRQADGNAGEVWRANEAAVKRILKEDKAKAAMHH
jgi:hypothetical protein